MRIVDDRYELQEALGRGGMGVVHRALDRRLNRAVAFKELAAGLAADEALRTRFVREAAALAKVRHPNVVAIHDTGVDDGTPWLVMALCEGGALADRLAEGPLPIAETRRVASDVLDALAAVHGAGLIHRDLKPGNILRDAGRWLVSDFGIAHDEGGSATHLTGTGFLIGTPEYWAPEFMGDQAQPTTASDVYALGCALYCALTGSPPFRADNGMRVAMMQATEPVPPLPEAVRVADPDFAALVTACLSKDPADRPTVAAAAEVIGRSLRPATLIATPEAPAEAGESYPSEAKQTSSTELARPGAIDTSPRRRVQRWVWIALPTALLLTLAAIAVAVALTSGPHDTPTASVATSAAPRPTAIRLPDLVGSTQQEARAQLAELARDAGLAAPRLVRSGTRYSDDQPRGRIISQAPSVGRLRTPGATVAFVLSKGARSVRVPSTDGTADEVVSRLRALDLEPQVTYAPSFEVPQGEVVSTDPRAGRSVRRPAQVRLVVSSGWRSDAIVIQGDSQVAGWPTGADGGINAGRLSTAETVFGAPVSKANVDGIGCDVAWSGDVGMRGYFYNLGGQDGCGPFGFMGEMVMTGPRFVTDKGLAIGSSLGKLRALYPDAYPTDADTGGPAYVLAERFSPIGDGGYFASLRATISDDVVTGFVLSYPGGGD